MTNDLNPQTNAMVEIQCVDRWQVYHRLRELEIPCWCSCYQPLKVQVSTVTAAIQVWSVVQRVTLSRQARTHWLDTCWQACRSPQRED